MVFFCAIIVASGKIMARKNFFYFCLRQSHLPKIEIKNHCQYVCKGETKGMANCKKFNRAACGHMFAHYERAKDENGEYIKFGNQDIDINKSKLNYNLAPDRNGQGEFVKKRCSEVKMQNRADVNVMCSWVVTAPKEIKKEETETFFKEAYKFLSERYGKENVVSAYVHMDEVTPHIHFAFVPVVKDKKKNILKVSAKELIDKRELQTFHKDLSEHMEKIFGRDIGILNEATKEGNKSIEELRRGTAQKEIEKIKEQIKEEQKKASKGIAEKTQEIERANEQINSLKKEQKVWEKKILDIEKIYEDKKLTQKEIEKIQPSKNVFGIQNITLEDISNLKNMAMRTINDKALLNKAAVKIKELTDENTELKKKVPTMMEEIERKRAILNLQDENNKSKNNYENLLKKYNNLIGAVNQLPAENIEFIKKIIMPSHEENNSHRSRNDYERD